MAAAWLDEREPELLYAARGTGRPLWLGEGRAGVVFASTRHALELVERYCGAEAPQARAAPRARSSRSAPARSSRASASA